MTVKIFGAEWKRFYSDPKFWPDGAWHDDVLLTVNGKDDSDGEIDLVLVNDTDRITVSGGVVFMSEDGNDSEIAPSMELHLKRWRKAQVTSTLLIEIPNENVDEFIKTIKLLGAKVLS